MENMIRTTVYLSKDIKRLVDEENINLSKWNNENLLIALSVDNEQDILTKKSELESKIKVLDGRLARLRETNADLSNEDAMKEQVTKELRQHFKERMKFGSTHDLNLSWITSAKNTIRCKALKEPPETVLKELEAWYDGSQKN